MPDNQPNQSIQPGQPNQTINQPNPNQPNQQNINIPEHVDINFKQQQPPTPIDPLSGMPPWLRIAASFSTTGIICALFIWMTFQMWNVRDDGFKQAEQSYGRFERFAEKITNDLSKFKTEVALELTKFKAEVASELQRHSDRADKNIEFRDMQNKDWIRNINEKNTIGHDKTLAGLKNLEDQFKLYLERAKLGKD